MNRKRLYEEIYYRDKKIHALNIDTEKGNADKWYNDNRFMIYESLIPKENLLICDIGSAEGRIKDSYLNIDIVKERLLDGKKNNRNSEFIQADVYYLPIRDKIFELSCCLELLEHLEQPELALLEIIRITKQYILISTPNGYFLRPDQIEHRYCYKPDELLYLLKKFNLKILKKCGNVPLIFQLLLNKPELLPLYKEMSINYHKKELSYYISTQMIVLCEIK